MTPLTALIVVCLQVLVAEPGIPIWYFKDILVAQLSYKFTGKISTR